MRSYVRFLTAAATASVLVLSACGGEAATPSSPDLSAGALTYAISPNNVGWSKQPADPIPTTTQSVLITGLIAVGGYPQFGAIQYSGNGNNWLDMTTTPDLSRSPLGWRFSFKLKPGAASLPIGTYTATIPVMVPAATNNPQSIVVTFNNCGNCLFVGDERLAALTNTDPIWDRSSTYNNDDVPGDRYPFDEWRVIVAPFSSVWVDMIGECDVTRPDVSHDDVYLYAWTTALAFVDSDDDGGSCNNSIFELTNPGATQMEFIVRATSYDDDTDSYAYGAYRIRVGVCPASGCGGSLRAAPEEGDKLTAEKQPLRP